MGCNAWFRRGCWRLCHNWSNYSWLVLMENNQSKIKKIEKEKLIAETLNGRFAMLGLIAALGAYLTTGQIIPGFV